MPRINYHSFRVKWMETMKCREGNEHKKELENFGARMSYHESLQSHAQLEIIKHGIYHSDTNEAIAMRSIVSVQF